MKKKNRVVVFTSEKITYDNKTENENKEFIGVMTQICKRKMEDMYGQIKK